MIKKLTLLSLTITLLTALALDPARAASIDQIKAQVSTFLADGKITDGDLASGLQNILDQAQSAESSGDEESKAMYLETFKGTLTEASGEVVDPSAAMTLQNMVP